MSVSSGNEAASAPNGTLPGTHRVQFYEDDGFLLGDLAHLVCEGLGPAGDGVVIIATPARREALAARVASMGADLGKAGAEGRYLALDAAETLARILVDGAPDPAAFARVVGRAIEETAARSPSTHVRAFGEMVALLYEKGEVEAAVSLEELWNDLVRRLPFSLLCGYSMQLFRAAGDGERLQRICARHTHVVPAESYSGLQDGDERLRVVALLQQKASALEAEAIERRRVEGRLALTGEALSDLFDNAAEGILQVGADGRILRANRALFELLGERPENVLGQSARSLHADPAAFDTMWEMLQRGEAVCDFPARFRCLDGSIRDVQVQSNGRWEDGRFLHTRCFVRDVTERRRLEAELGARLAQLAEADRRKDEFLAMLGHELRNPLSAVRNAIATASLDEQRRGRALEIARRQADQLGRLIDDLVDVARITQGRITLRKARVDLREVVEAAVESVRPFVDDRGHVLDVRAPEEALAVEADPARLEQVLVNLLTNAAKYTDPGGHLEVATGREGDVVFVAVRDDGMGIPADLLPKVFDLFTQADRSLDRLQGGLGLGLTIARRIVEQHGGAIEARSAGRGHGSEFVVRLRAPRGTSGEGTGAEPAFAAGAHRLNVVMVEDNPDAAESLRMLLELLGCEVRAAHDGVAALETARRDVPDLMLVDIGLPGMDGYEVARRLREVPALASTMLVALTGYGRDEDRERAIASGFDRHLVKPLDPSALDRLLAEAGRRERPAAPSAAGAGSARDERAR